ncbi:MAG: family 31 glucosidase, partial [Trebonia sp.]
MGAFSEDGAALVWRGGHETVRIEPWGPDSVRVRGTLWPSVSDDLPGALLAAPPPSGARTELAADVAWLVNGQITAEI